MRKAMTVDRINKEIDTAVIKLNQSGDYITQILTSYITAADSLNDNKVMDKSLKQYIGSDSIFHRAAITAEVNARSVKNAIEINIQNRKLHIKNLDDHKIEYHRRFTIPFACLLLFTIGAALGAIIRKGGLGMPFICCRNFLRYFTYSQYYGRKNGTKSNF